MAESPWAEVTCSACSVLEAEDEVRRLLATASDISGLEAGAGLLRTLGPEAHKCGGRTLGGCHHWAAGVVMAAC